jgi:uncharacterized alkaline shock family protein YloU
MKEESKLDFGAIKVHKKAIAEIVLTSIRDVEGVTLLKQDFLGTLLELTGTRHYPGITVNIDKNNQVCIEIKVRVQFGLNLQETARQVQEVVKTAIEKTVDIDIKDIHVVIYGIERGEK